ncbi:MAG TPA: CDGSH iron-sulfur domain-containing protein [Candidatus Limnocylindria bacterium]|nr:CDGSH iron-sulfur domain-containing protein [Candidatus Limnocylindria bacterium]
MTDEDRQGSITIEPNGPYVVVGPLTVFDADGNAHVVPAGKRARLCRCGHSANKPFCDDSHSRVDFVSRPHFRPE